MGRVASAHTAVSPPEPWLSIGLTMGQLKAMFMLNYHGTLRVGNIAQALGMSANAATAVIDRLEEVGYVQRVSDRSDRRAVLTSLTASGSEMVSELLSMRSDGMARFLRRMSEEDLRTLEQGVIALVTAIDAEAAAQRSQPPPSPESAS